MIAIKEIEKRFGAEPAFIILILRIYFKKAVTGSLSIFLKEHSLNWGSLKELIYMYEIRPLIYKVLAANSANIDKEFLTDLKNDCLFIVGSNFEKLKEVHHLYQVFQKHDLKVVPFKGVFLSQLLFGDYTTRETCDIDFLFYGKDSIAITKILFSEGYQTDFYFNPPMENFILKISSGRSFHKSDTVKSETVEVHWMLLQPSFDVPLSNKMLLENTNKEKIFGKEIGLLNLEYSFLTLLGHHGVTDVWRSLKHVVDTTAFLDKHSEKINWFSFEIMLKNNRIEKTGKLGIMLANQLFGVSLPPVRYPKKWKRATQEVLDTLLTYPMLNKFKYSFKHFARHVSLRDSFSDKFRFLINCFGLLFTPTANDLKWISFSKNWFFIYYFLKPFRLTRDYLWPGREKIRQKE